VKVFGCDGTGTVSDVAAGIEHVADQGWDVANLSFGGAESSTLEDAVRYAEENGVLLVGAAGNSGECSDCVTYPAAYDEVVAVSATASDDSLASFSSTGPEVELAAPGVDIYAITCGRGYDLVSGTSMAAPHVAGAGAQVMADGTTNAQARDTLTQTAEDVGLADNESGAGLLDVAAALGLDSSDST
jgi:subtilisin